jgi:ATP-dependent exoDNAse (exonuclease V) beta subunit
MYVAFTRAEEKLYVFAPDKPKDGEKSCASILKSLMNESAELKNALSISENNFSLGEELPAKRKEKSDSDNFENPQTVELSKIFHPFNRKKIGFKLKKYESEEQEELIETGIAVHQLLSEFILATDVNTITEKLKSKKYYEKISDLVGYGMQIITEEKWTKEFYEIKTECELVSSEGEIFRPDRLMYKDGKAIVVDYKTGKQDLKHTAQLNSYEKVLLQVGFTEVEKYLIYLSAKEIVEITS